MYDQHIILDFEMNPVSNMNKGIRRALSREIIEIGAVKLNSAFKVIDSFSCFVKPQYNSDVEAFIIKLTGITSADVNKAVSFCEAMCLFEKWIGEGKTRVYSWSDSDLIQLRKECLHKGVPMPASLGRWVDFQAVFPRIMKIGNRHRKMSLHDALTWYGIEIDDKNTHRALYDAELTTEIVIPVLSGEYKKQIEIFNANIISAERTEDAVCIGDLCGGVLGQLLQSMNQEPKFVL